MRSWSSRVGIRQEVEQALQEQPARTVYNPRFAEDQMALSLQAGLASLSPGVEAALIALGDQPQIQLEVVQMVIRRFQESRARLVFPSYRMRRGHPWLIARPLWGKLGAASSTGVEKPETMPVQSLRDFLQTFADQIAYIEVTDDSILRDVDTPSDYLKERPVQPAATEQEKP